MRKINSEFNTKFISESGSFIQNRDYFAFVELDNFACYVIADGIDEDYEKDSAQIAVEGIIREFIDKPSMKRRTLKRLMAYAHRELKKNSGENNLKCSLTVVISDYANMMYSYGGNTRLHLYRKGAFKEKTEDHSLSQNLVEDETIPKDKLQEHRERNNLYCYGGMSHQFKPFISKKIKLQEGDILTLMSRGIWENMDEGEFIDVLNDSSENSELLDGAEELILSKQPEELQNYTLAGIFIDKVYENPKKKKKILKTVIKIMIPILIILLLFGIVMLVKHFKNKEKLENMNAHLKNAVEYVQKNNYPRAQEEYEDALKLSRELKLKEKIVDIDKKFKLSEQIVKADETFMESSYEDAHEQYTDAQIMSYRADNMAKDYIEKKLERVSTFIEVNDLLILGDTMLEMEDLKAAEKDYKDAKDKAQRIFYAQGRKEALTKLKDTRELMAETEKAQQEEAAKEEEDAKAQEQEMQEEQSQKNDALEKSIENEKNGDSSMRAGSYEDAIIYYTLAYELYKEAGMGSRGDNVLDKKALAQKKIDDKVSIGELGKSYEEEGDKLLQDQEYNKAKMLYLMARDKYQEGENQEKKDSVDEKIEVLDAIIQENKDNEVEQPQDDQGEKDQTDEMEGKNNDR